MSTVSRVIDELFNSSGEEYLRALSFDQSWDDAVSVSMVENTRYPTESPETRNSFIYRRLGHLTVNPHQIENTSALTEAYVWSDDNRPGIINASSETAESFIDDLIEAAQKERKAFIGLNVPDRAAAGHGIDSAFTIFGDRGIGKTFFLNFLLANFWTKLDDPSCKTIWVRINLVTNFAPNNNLRNWIYAQVAKIILRYYDLNQSHRRADSNPPIAIDFEEHLDNFVKDKYANRPERRSELQDHIVKMMQVLRDVEYEEAISESLVPPILGAEIMRYAIEMGYNFIVVLDGLDRLDITRSAKGKFDDLIAQAEELHSKYEARGFALVMVSRTKTLENLGSFLSDPYKQGSTTCKSLGRVPLDKVVDRRVEVIREEVRLIGAKFGWPLFDWTDHIDDFKSQLYYKDGPRNLLDELERALGPTNIRAQIQMVQFDYLDYLKRKKARAYKVIEYLTKAGRKYPPRHWSYHVDLDGLWSHVGGDEPRPYDSKFLPYLFSFPIADSNGGSFPGHLCNHLAGLRICQILSAYQVLTESDPPVLYDDINAREIANICNVLFGYQLSLIYLIIEEFAEFELINLNGGLYVQPIDPAQYRIIVNPKLHFVLNRALFDIAYLNLVAMRTPVCNIVLDREQNTHPYFRVDSIDEKRERIDHESVISNWVFSKIVNGIGLYKIVYYLNNYQKNDKEQNMVNLTPREKRIAATVIEGKRNKLPSCFDIGDLMKKELSTQINNALVNFQVQHGEASMKKLIDRIRKHFYKWIGMSAVYR